MEKEKTKRPASGRVEEKRRTLAVPSTRRSENGLCDLSIDPFRRRMRKNTGNSRSIVNWCMEVCHWKAKDGKNAHGQKDSKTNSEESNAG